MALTEGIYHTFPLISLDEYKNAFGPDETNAAYNFSFTVGSLHYFLMNMAIDAPQHFKQCACCLKVSKTVTTAKELEALLTTCNQDAKAARLTIINAAIKEAHNKALL